MSVINPNNKPRLLVDDFITLAKQHLLTIQGQALTQTTYSTSAGAILPGICYWNGYFVEDIPPAFDTDIPNLPKVSTKFKVDDVPTRVLFIEDVNLEADLRGQGVVYDNLKTASGETVRNYGSTAQTTFVATNIEARNAIELYLGRAITDAEMSDLIAITFAEATSNQTERAWVMGTILNRTRIGYTPLGIQNKRYKYSTITDIINQPSQYQPVTGTKKNPGPKQNFIDGPNAANARAIYGAAAKLLKDVPKAYINFTANSPSAYGPGTNINYMYNLRASPNSKIIGGTVFGF
jgi:hypothetical protein